MMVMCDSVSCLDASVSVKRKKSCFHFCFTHNFSVSFACFIQPPRLLLIASKAVNTSTQNTQFPTTRKSEIHLV